jgi:hypothetical protein
MRRRHIIGLAAIILSVGLYGIANATPAAHVEITKIETNYPLSEHSINLPNDSSKLDIKVEAKEADSVRFYYDTAESEGEENQQMILEDNDPRDGFQCIMNYDSEEGFARNIVIVASSKHGETQKKRFSVYKGVETEDLS